MSAFSGPDSLRIESAAVEVPHLHLIGTIPGVIPLVAAARNGPGSGHLSSSGDGRRLHWRAPASNVRGVGVRAAADGTYLLRDGEDADKWLRVQVDVSELAGGPRQAVVDLAERYNNPVASDDVSAAEASAGDIETHTLTLVNQSNAILSQIKVWIDPGGSNLEISDDGIAWVAPTRIETALELPDLAVADTDTLHLRRTIVAGAGPDAGLLNRLHFSFFGQ